jgi:histidinol-phosphate aminotransferase
VTPLKIEELVRKEVLGLSLYEVSGGSDRSNGDKVVRLDMNENFAVDRKVVGEMLLEACQNIDARMYPPAYGELAVKALSSFLNISESEISVANGSDDLLDIIMKIFVKDGSRVAIVEPTFTTYTHFLNLYGGKKIPILLTRNFQLDSDTALSSIDEETKLMLICSPNNPTGNQFSEESVRRILNEFDGIVVVDEAYVDFAKYSVASFLSSFSNLVVLRTFSKSLGLAGMRFGYLLSDKSVVNCARKATAPLNLSTITQRIAVLALQKWSYFKKKIQDVIKERDWLINNLSRIDGVTPYPSDANFILFKINRQNLSSSEVASDLAKRNVLVKDRGSLPLLANCIRVTVGTRNMNETFLSALRKTLEE